MPTALPQPRSKSAMTRPPIKPRRGRKRLPAPPTVDAFVDTLLPIRKHSTCKGIRNNLQDFHRWLIANSLSLVDLDRPSIECWLQSLADRKLVPTTRCARICHVRKYLEWLSERNEIQMESDYLLRSSDFPKIPSHLPRPFPVNADREMIRRFLDSKTLWGRALFILRRSGLRIGELSRLEVKCLEIDLFDNAFLKVPLGKLDNERLVPIDAQTRKFVESLQIQAPDDASFLISSNLSRKTIEDKLRNVLKDAAIGLDIQGPVVPHRLRHTYATELINAGMSLTAIMRLLGHRSFRMTMRYAAIAQKTVADDYHAAMAKIANQYKERSTHNLLTDPNPERFILDAISWLRKNIDQNPGNRRRSLALIKRLYRLHSDISAFVQQTSSDC